MDRTLLRQVALFGLAPGAVVVASTYAVGASGALPVSGVVALLALAHVAAVGSFLGMGTRNSLGTKPFVSALGDVHGGDARDDTDGIVDGTEDAAAHSGGGPLADDDPGRGTARPLGWQAKVTLASLGTLVLSVVLVVATLGA